MNVNSPPPKSPNATLENMTRGTKLLLLKLQKQRNSCNHGGAELADLQQNLVAKMFADELTTTYGRLLMVPIKNRAIYDNMN